MVREANGDNSALAMNESMRATVMDPDQKTGTVLVDPIINIKLKLAMLWIVLVFFYLYNDVISFFRQDTIEGVLSGAPGGVEITPVFLLAGAFLMSIPIFMVFLCIALPARTDRPVNIIVGIFHLVVLATTMIVVEEAPWAHYALYMVFEGLIIVLIIWYAWKWPTQDCIPS